MSGRVVLVGAGPGDPDLLTVRAARELAQAEVLLYDALIEPALVELAPADCEKIDVGKRGDGTRGTAQSEIAAIMIDRARRGRTVVRLKGGDPFLFGRGGEEASALAEAGVPFEIVPGISSAYAVPAYAGVPLTDRRMAGSVVITTGHRADRADVNRTDWEGLATRADTLVVMMGTAWLDEIARRLVAGGRAAETPAAVIAHGATPRQRVVLGRLDDIAARVREADLRAPTVIVVGEVARLHETLAWYERRPLFGKRVLVLRAVEQRAELVERLARAGAAPVLVPVLGFEGCGDAPRVRAADFDWIAFTSANAVRFALPLLGELGAARVACVGEATARAARAHGLDVALVPEGAASGAELAGALAAGADLAGRRVLFAHGVGARDELPDALERAGAEVERVAVYRNVVPEDAEPRLRKVVEEGLDAVLLTSPTSVERLAWLLGAESFERLARRAVFVCIGPTTARAAAEHGVDALVADEASPGGLVAALERHYARSLPEE